MNVQDFQPIDVNQGGLSVTSKIVINFRGYFVCQGANGVLRVNGNITMNGDEFRKCSRVGKDAKLITDDNIYLMFRNRQINYVKEFDYSIKLAKRKRNPCKIFCVYLVECESGKDGRLAAQVIAQAAKAEGRHKRKCEGRQPYQ